LLNFISLLFSFISFPFFNKNSIYFSKIIFLKIFY
jgi:hypothetical protein